MLLCYVMLGLLGILHVLMRYLLKGIHLLPFSSLITVYNGKNDWIVIVTQDQ